MEHSLAMKRKILSFAINCMDFEGIMLSEISQIGKHKYLIYMWTLKKKQTSELTNKENRLLVARSEG